MPLAVAILYAANKLALAPALLHTMTIITILTWILGGALTLGLGFIVKEWLWNPLMLIELCKRQGIKGFPFVPFVGQMPAIDEVLSGRNRRVQKQDNDEVEDEDRLTAVTNCYRNHGSTFYFTVGRTVRLSIADPPLIKDILIANSESYSKPLHIRKLGVLGDGIFASSGSTWSPQRSLFTGAFHTKEVKSKIPTMIDCAHSAVEKWSRELNDGYSELDMYQKFAELTLDVIGKTAFGTEEIGGASEAASVIGSFNRYLLYCRELVFGPPATFPTSFARRNSHHSGAAETVSDRHDLLDVIIGAVDNIGHSEEGAKKALNEAPDQTISEKRKRAAEMTRLTEKQLLDNALTVLLAGHETTASLLTWTIYLLAKHPLWQKRARAEVEEFCPGGVVEPQVLSHLKLLGMILLESLRLFPPVPLIGRMCIKDNKVGPDLLIPEGLEIVIPVAVLHRDRTIWGDNADEFAPARFGNGISGACGNPLAFLPFGAGPRTCIGQTLALSEAKAVLAVMLPLFSWKLSTSYRHSPDVTLTMMPEFGMPVVLEKIEK
uniref:Cytochrome P450 n=1 Tax=Physcomitrium patens TaxID=3218 RepID=A0A7I4BU64_PHYPA